MGDALATGDRAEDKCFAAPGPFPAPPPPQGSCEGPVIASIIVASEFYYGVDARQAGLN